jgi:hypothetical protein
MITQPLNENEQKCKVFKFCLKISTEVSKNAELLADLKSFENKAKKEILSQMILFFN